MAGPCIATLLNPTAIKSAPTTKGSPYQKAMRKRRVWRVNCEALLIATGQNLKRLLQTRGWGRRPFPDGAVAAADRFSLVSPPFVLGVAMVHIGRFCCHHRKSATDHIELAA